MLPAATQSFSAELANPEGPMVRRLSGGGNWIRTLGPAPPKGSSGRCQSETAARKAEPLTGSGPKRQCLPRVAAHSLPFAEGPRVRIRLPPPKSHANPITAKDHDGRVSGKSPAITAGRAKYLLGEVVRVSALVCRIFGRFDDDRRETVLEGNGFEIPVPRVSRM
jgi:hypothetical protein